MRLNVLTWFKTIMEAKMSKANKIAYFLISIIFFMAFDLYFSALIIDSLRFKIEEKSCYGGTGSGKTHYYQR